MSWLSEPGCPADTLVELQGCDGSWWTLAGPGAGNRGVWLASGVTGLHDPPVKVVYEEPGNWPGARYLNHRVLRRDIVFAVTIMHDREESWSERDSLWRRAWAFDKDSFLRITTESGTRTLKLRLWESPEVSYEHDPRGKTANNVGMVCIAGDPYWWEDDVVYSVVTKTDTRFDPEPYWKTPKWADLPKEELHIVVDDAVDGKGGVNPTDQAIWPKWTMPGSQEPVKNFPEPWPPGIAIPWERAPFTQWVIPDYDFTPGSDKANRRLRLPGLIKGEDIVVDADPRVEQVSSVLGTQVWARMNGVRFRFPVPPYTAKKDFHITVTGCRPGQMVTLRLPRPWSRPWGMN